MRFLRAAARGHCEENITVGGLTVSPVDTLVAIVEIQN